MKEASSTPEIVRENVRNKLFMEPGKSIIIEGKCVLAGFQNSKEIYIERKCKKSNFHQISAIVSVTGNASTCVFSNVGRVEIYGSAKNCIFVGIDRDNIFIEEGTSRGCILDGAPFVMGSRIIQKIFSFGAGPVIFKMQEAALAARRNALEVKRVQPPPPPQKADDEDDKRRNNVVVDNKRQNDNPVFAQGITTGGRSGGNTIINSVKSRGISWGGIKGSGGMMMRGYTVELTGSGTIGGIPVTPGRYAKRLGEDDTLYRQDMSASPTSSPWQVYKNGQWAPTELTPTLGL